MFHGAGERERDKTFDRMIFIYMYIDRLILTVRILLGLGFGYEGVPTTF